VDDLSDIKRTVHEIQDGQHRQAIQIARLEAGHQALKESAHEVNLRLHSRIDDLASGQIKIEQVLSNHTAQEDLDRKKMMQLLITILLSVLGALGMYLFDHLLGGG